MITKSNKGHVTYVNHKLKEGAEAAHVLMPTVILDENDNRQTWRKSRQVLEWFIKKFFRQTADFH